MCGTVERLVAVVCTLKHLSCLFCLPQYQQASASRCKRLERRWMPRAAGPGLPFLERVPEHRQRLCMLPHRRKAACHAVRRRERLSALRPNGDSCSFHGGAEQGERIGVAADRSEALADAVQRDPGVVVLFAEERLASCQYPLVQRQCLLHLAHLLQALRDACRRHQCAQVVCAERALAACCQFARQRQRVAVAALLLHAQRKRG
mmetsp:Transcript_8086/g.24382  ORF Transcript_8086/g.24382 Transcript_8086/m.24382 type:complete len:205 (+) Transcript_8086:1233-1847(+)